MRVCACVAQVEAHTAHGETAHKVLSLVDATTALLGVADQGGGCPVPGHPWPEYTNISAGPLGGVLSHAARFTEMLQGRRYQEDDAVGHPTGPAVDVDWSGSGARMFIPNPTVAEFLPSQCVAGGAWVVRNSTFFVLDLWMQHNKTLYTRRADTWQDCAVLCDKWTIGSDDPMAPCSMWTWVRAESPAFPELRAHTCLLGQQWVAPTTARVPNLLSGCQFGTVCNNSLPLYPGGDGSAVPSSPTRVSKALVPPEALAEECRKAHARVESFASNYTAFLVKLHNVFNGRPDTLMSTIGQMYRLKAMAIDLMETNDPRIRSSLVGIGPPWEYVAAASQFEMRRRQARPIFA